MSTKFFTICYSRNISWSNFETGKHFCVSLFAVFLSRESLLWVLKNKLIEALTFWTKYLASKLNTFCGTIKERSLYYTCNLNTHSLSHPNIYTFIPVNSGCAFRISFMFLFFWHGYLCVCVSFMLLLRSYDDEIFRSLYILY